MTCKIEWVLTPVGFVVFRVSGHIDGGYVELLQELIEGFASIVPPSSSFGCPRCSLIPEANPSSGSIISAIRCCASRLALAFACV